jgi:hypothetical protein
MERLTNPGGIEIFGGADIVSVRSADNSTYVVYCGERRGSKFGTHVYRIVNGRAEWVELPAFTETRAGVTVEPDGMFLTWPIGASGIVRIKVPGYVTPGFPSAGAGAALPPSPVVVSSQDTTARASIDALRTEYRESLAKTKRDLEAKINAMPKPASGVSEQSARDIAWSLAADRFYAELQNIILAMIKELQ